MVDPSPTLLDANAAMLRAVASHNENTRFVLMPRGEIDRIRMPCTRGDDETTVELPPSLKALLEFDSKSFGKTLRAVRVHVIRSTPRY